MRPLVTDRDKDTICAVATAHGLGAISVIRISGTQAATITLKLAAFLPESPESHRIYYGVLRTADTGEPVDEVLVSYFREGRSFTGETTCEISCHGSEAVVDEILRQLVAAGARPAERGEFTYRAFMHGRLDLVQAESVLALIESRSPRAARLALRQLQGDISARLNSILDRLVWTLANLEANIDFAAEDIVIAEQESLSGALGEALRDTEELLSGYRRGRLIRDGFQVAIVGRPNVGKSSLLNALAGDDLAIVTPVAGTTRDFVQAQLSVGGVRVSLVDTAGLRQSDDPVEKIGVARSLKRLAEVDLVLFVYDGANGLTAEDREFFPAIPWDRSLVLANKSDLGHSRSEDFPGSLGEIRVSAVSHAGLTEVVRRIEERLRLEVGEDATVISNARHFRGLEVVREAVARALPLVDANESPDLIALELQAAVRAVHEILGLTYDDQVMDRVFSEFCLGK